MKVTPGLFDDAAGLVQVTGNLTARPARRGAGHMSSHADAARRGPLPAAAGPDLVLELADGDQDLPGLAAGARRCAG